MLCSFSSSNTNDSGRVSRYAISWISAWGTKHNRKNRLIFRQSALLSQRMDFAPDGWFYWNAFLKIFFSRLQRALTGISHLLSVHGCFGFQVVGELIVVTR